MEPQTTTVRDIGASVVRMFVATAVGTLVAWLAKNAHIIIDNNTSAGLVQAFTATVIGVYYLVVRFLETKVPAFGWLFGLAKLPTYPAPAGEKPTP
jgi:mannitol-specific phosphotransferase system IIBC component